MDYAGYLRAVSREPEAFQRKMPLCHGSQPVTNNGAPVFVERALTESELQGLCNFLRSHIPENQEEREALLEFGQRVHNLPGNPALATISDVFQNCIIRKVHKAGMEEGEIDIHCSDVLSSDFLKTFTGSDFAEGAEAVISVGDDLFSNLEVYLGNKGQIDESMTLEQLLYLDGIADFFLDDTLRLSVLGRIKHKIESSSLEALVAIHKETGEGLSQEVHLAIAKKIGSYAPKKPEEAILTFYQNIHRELGDSASNIAGLSFHESEISKNILDQLIVLFPNVISLDMTSCRINAAKMEELVGSLKQPSWQNLTMLDIEENDLEAKGARALSALVNLTSLNIRGNNLGPEGARALSPLVNLTSLNIGHNNLGDEGARALSPLVHLISLNIRDNNLGAEGARALSALVHLTSLNIQWNNLGDEGARALSALVNLTSLDIGRNNLGDEGARALSALVHLTSLNIVSNNLGPEGARALSALVHLTSLNIGSNYLGDEGARALSALVHLISLDIVYNNLGAEAEWALKTALPRAEITL
jgi:hypothetical protein